MLNLPLFFEDSFKLPALLKPPTNLSGEMAAFIMLMSFGTLSLLEFAFPRQKLPASHLRLSYKTNISLFIFNSSAMSLVSISSLFLLAHQYSDQGLYRYLENNTGVQLTYGLQAVLSFLLLDLLLYLWHRACHHFDWLWMFHKVHHNDPVLNVSTAFRVHFLELLITNILKAGLIIILGINETIVLSNEIIITLFIMFHHTNISFYGESLLGRVIIVPALHHVHHSIERNEHDSNYGAVLAIWDRLFGTMKELKTVVTGIKGNSPQDFTRLLMFGFTMEAAKPVQTPANLEVMIAEAAYYKAEKRNFHPGNELLDWLEAKREIFKLVYGDKYVYKNSQAQLS